jgi:hypothetical protein
MNSMFMESALNINELWQPLSSSYTQSSSDGGGQTKSDDELSDSGIATRDGDKNEGTRANK